MLSELKKLLGLLGGETLDDAAKRALKDEAMLVILSRATISDTNISAVEVATVQRIVEAHTGASVEEKDIRATAHNHLYETNTFDDLVSRIAGALDKADRIEIAAALAEVIKADGKTSPFEAEFFNTVTSDLKVDRADLASL